jgi:1-acyl-sn-glycerol-3-phosphate acyltransferase
MPSEGALQFLWGFVGGACAGAALTLLQQHPTRRRAWKPLGFLLLLGAALAALSAADIRLVGGLVGGGLIAGVASSRTRWVDTVVPLCLVVCLSLFADQVTWEPNLEVFLAITCGIASAVSLWIYRRPVGETLGEWILRLMYRMRVTGPGVAQLTRTGPVLVISNHTAYFDPCWVMIPLPRDLTPIMYGEYFRKFGLHFYMKHIIDAIPSGVGAVRRDVPELAEAVRRLDKGEGVLIFPEGWVRRKEDESIRRFAQGAWRILRDRPAIPVVACWIEGGWGSWTSYSGGPPFKNKTVDFRRPIDIGVSAPVVLDPETLVDQMRTRELLREMVLGARRHLGLSPLLLNGAAGNR